MIGKLVKGICARKEIKMSELAEAVDKTPQNLHGLLKRDDLRESEMAALANALGCDLKIVFVDRKTGKIYD